MKIGFDLQTILLGTIMLITLINVIGTIAVSGYIKSYTDPVFGWVKGATSSFVTTVNWNIAMSVLFLICIPTWYFAIPNKRIQNNLIPLIARCAIFAFVFAELIAKSVLAYKSNGKYFNNILSYIMKDGDINPDVELSEAKMLEAIKWMVNAAIKEDDMYMLDRKVMPFLVFTYMNAMLIALYWLSALVFNIFPDFVLGGEPILPEDAKTALT